MRVLLLAAVAVLMGLFALVPGLPFALAGEQAALLGEGVLSGLVNAVMVVVAVCGMVLSCSLVRRALVVQWLASV